MKRIFYFALLLPVFGCSNQKETPSEKTEIVTNVSNSFIEKFKAQLQTIKINSGNSQIAINEATTLYYTYKDSLLNVTDAIVKLAKAEAQKAAEESNKKGVSVTFEEQKEMEKEFISKLDVTNSAKTDSVMTVEFQEFKKGLN